MNRTKHLWFRASLVAVVVAASALTLRGSSTQHRAHLSKDLVSHLAFRAASSARVIVSGSDQDIDDAATRYGLRVLRRLDGGAVLAGTGDGLNQLASDGRFENLSGDMLVRNTMSVSNVSTAAAQTRTGQPGLLGIGGIPGVTGQGIGIAVVDSGINTSHAALYRKVVASVSLVTGDTSTGDGFGHGTHVAGIIAGVPTSVTPSYTGGIAPGANLINVRVLGNDGSGYTSDVIAGINWVIANKDKYNIRVMNLSLGHAVTESCTTDPLCQAVGRAYAAGIVVVAAAGNAGRSADGRTVLGSILSPGNSPLAITVGALNTMGTTARGDDTITTYSSRGPTEYDFTVKPDVAAPGNRIIALEARNSYLENAYPAIHVAGTGNNAYMWLSGTSMATPMVSGGVALLLQGTPGLSPAQVKVALQLGATYMPDAGLIGAGAGSVNFWASRKLVASGLVNTLTSTLTNTLSAVLGAGSSGIAYFDSGSMSHRIYNRTGVRLLSLLDTVLAILNPSLLKFGDLNLAGSSNPLYGLTGSNWLVWGQVAGFTRVQSGDEILWGTSGGDEILWGTRMYSQSGDEILWGTSGGDEILWGTSTTLTAENPQ
jgi:serine protease AprX